jgi:hypothetical protein
MLHHVLSVLEYGLDYLELETLSRAENCIPCLLHCKKRVIDKIVRMFFIRAQESAVRKSKAEGVRHIISIQQHVNEYALGRPGNPGSFKILYDEKEATLSDIKMDGTVAPRLLAAMDDQLVHRFFGKRSEISEAEKIHGQQSSRCCMTFLKHYHRGKILLTNRLMNFRWKLILSVSNGLNLQDVRESLITST